ncbi:MAG: hypothetical protein GXO33_01050 [Epsilonproteobacteria bacterium]|jgi:hypothetical protein|nr:hypothetical protein [Campylobacterota bacterium]
MKQRKERNFWPYAILGMILTVVMLGIWTIKIAVTNPVQMSNDYMMNYQDVDENYNELQARQKAFMSKYEIDLSRSRLEPHHGLVVVRVTDKSGKPVVGADVIAVVQRPTTNKYNIELKKFRYERDSYVSEPFDFKGVGRWNIQVKVKVGDDVGFATWKAFVPDAK